MMEDFYMPTDIQFKDDLRKEEIKLEELLNLLKNQEYEKLQKKLERDLKRVRESLQDYRESIVSPQKVIMLFRIFLPILRIEISLFCAKITLSGRGDFPFPAQKQNTIKVPGG